MAASVMKVEMEIEACCICGGGGELMSPEEHDASTTVMLAPLRTMLMHLNNNKVVPDGRLCADCIRRTIDSYEFSTTLSTKSVPPLSEKIRALRRRLHELTQKIDVFIVVGGPGVNAGGTYSEEDIIMVEKDALAAASAADDEDLERARNARGDTVYQCSVCPHSFHRVSEYRAHCATHPADALHSCWTCGAQFAARDALRDHARDHADAALVCHLCNTTFQSQVELRRHEGGCAGACPACGEWVGARTALAAHALARHARSSPALCAACFQTLPGPAALAAHMLRHRQAKQYVCGYDGCILRFGTR
ncbi:zinc finger protein 284-like [Ostrinia nubilalis]|uniref:zinc finger protein 284-like n=1 Tax=Ostrinia nubilalis TaxID=29057 RepID=UPI0030826217